MEVVFASTTVAGKFKLKINVSFLVSFLLRQVWLKQTVNISKINIEKLRR